MTHDGARIVALDACLPVCIVAMHHHLWLTLIAELVTKIPILVELPECMAENYD